MTNDKTIKQLADELGCEKHIIKYQVKKLSGEYLDNRSGVIYIKPKGISIIKGKLNGESTGEKEDNASDKVDNNSLVTFLLKEVEEKNNQIKDFQKLLENQQKLLDQQQILTLQANKKIEELELKNEDPENDEGTEGKIEKEPQEKNKSFFQRLFGK